VNVVCPIAPRQRPRHPCGCPARALSREARELGRGAPPCTFRRTLQEGRRGLPGGRFDPGRRQPRSLVGHDADLVRLRRPDESRHSGQGYCLGRKHPNRYTAASAYPRRSSRPSRNLHPGTERCATTCTVPLGRSLVHPRHKLGRRTSETRIGPLPIASRGEENTSGADPKARPAGVAVLVLPF